MKSPVTGKEMPLKTEERLLEFRKEIFRIDHHYYLCEGSGEQFTSTDLDEINMAQVYHQYRERHNLPFPEEILQIRDKYGLSSTKMAEILGLGINSYRNYENGEVPNQSNGNLIHLIHDPQKFRSLAELSDALDPLAKRDLLRRVDELIKQEARDRFHTELEVYLLKSELPDEYSGYRKPNLARLAGMIVFFTKELRPWKTQMNKLLFYADFLSFKETCYSMSGARYRAIKMGPVVNNYNSVFEYICNQHQVEIAVTEFPNGAVGEQFVAVENQPIAEALFSAREMDVLRRIAERFRGLSTADMIEISHQEDAWIDNKDDRNLISYKYGFHLREI